MSRPRRAAPRGAARLRVLFAPIRAAAPASSRDHILCLPDADPAGDVALDGGSVLAHDELRLPAGGVQQPVVVVFVESEIDTDAVAEAEQQLKFRLVAALEALLDTRGRPLVRTP